MGYSHHWRTLDCVSPNTASQYQTALASIKGFVEQQSQAPILIERDVRHLNFNNRPPCEPFKLPEFLDGFGLGWHHCKTEHLPYDSIVTGCLVLLNRIAPDAWEITSDGGEEEWKHGQTLATLYAMRNLDQLFDIPQGVLNPC